MLVVDPRQSYLFAGNGSSDQKCTGFDPVRNHFVFSAVQLFDTLNHITTWDGWTSVFENAGHHLKPGGLFIFDLNTLGHLRELGEMAPWVHDFDDHTLIMDVDFTGNPIARWNIRIFERQSSGTYRLHQEVIDELGVPLARVREALTADFEVIVQSDVDGSTATDDSERAIFLAQRR